MEWGDKDVIERIFRGPASMYADVVFQRTHSRYTPGTAALASTLTLMFVSDIHIDVMVVEVALVAKKQDGAMRKAVVSLDTSMRETPVTEMSEDDDSGIAGGSI